MVSGLAELIEDSPYTVWLRELGVELARRCSEHPACLTLSDLPESFSEGWAEWLPEWLMVFLILSPKGRCLGIAAYAVESLPDEERQTLLARLMPVYGYAWTVLAPPRSSRRILTFRRSRLLLAALVPIILAIPIRLSVLAPAEVIALDAQAVSAPMEGVVGAFSVQPNQPVKKGQLLFTLDDTTLRNRREVSLKQLQVARADALASAQKAFDSEASRAELASFNGKVAEREAELAYINELLQRIEVRSPGDGVIVFGDANDWVGKPVVTGERVALLADPRDAGVLIWLPVSEAANLERGAEVKLYLQVAPLSPLKAELVQTSYQAVPSPEGFSAYRLRARIEPESLGRVDARIGLKGTAKIYGERAPIAYYLLRRPLAALRERLGI
jgi:multidrug efflux pump subunit AcrA (membrane-fusion protein)